MNKVEKAKEVQAKIFTERLMSEIRSLVEIRDRQKEGLARLTKVLTDEESKTAKLQGEISALDKQILDLLSEAGDVAKESRQLRKLRDDLADSRARIEGLKAAIPAKGKELSHCEHDLLEAVQEKIRALRGKAQLEIHAQMGAILDRMEGWRDALSDLCQALGIGELIMRPYQNREGQYLVSRYAAVEDFYLDPRPPRFFEYLSSTLNEEPWNPGGGAPSEGDDR